MKKNFALLPLCFAFSLPFNVLASNANSELSYVDEQSLTISFDYGNRTGVYSGGLKNGVPDGVGMFTTSNDDGQNWKYIGEWEDGHFNGIGTTIFDIGQVSVATYVNDYMNGKGLMVQSDSTIYTGEFKNGLRDGIGTLYWANGIKYEGTFADNYINGTGTIYYLASGAYIEGTFTENIETGFVDGSGTYFFGNESSPCTITNGELQVDDFAQDGSAIASNNTLDKTEFSASENLSIEAYDVNQFPPNTHIKEIFDIFGEPTYTQESSLFNTYEFEPEENMIPCYGLNNLLFTFYTNTDGYIESYSLCGRCELDLSTGIYNNIIEDLSSKYGDGHPIKTTFGMPKTEWDTPTAAYEKISLMKDSYKYTSISISFYNE